MKIIFFGVTKKDTDSFKFFEKMDEYGISCDVNTVDSTITLHNVPRNLRRNVINEIKTMFEVELIQTRQDDIKASSIVPYQNEFEKEFMRFSELQLTPKDKISYLKNFNSELSLLSKNKKLTVREGDIIQCHFNSPFKGELNNDINVIVFKNNIVSSSFIGIPFSLFNLSDNGNFIMSIPYHVDTERMSKSILLNFIQPIPYVRCIKKVGFVDYGTMALISQRLCKCIKCISIEEAVAKFMKPALCAYNVKTEEVHSDSSKDEKLQIFFNMLHIPEHLKLLRLSFTMTLLTKEVTLKSIIALIQQNCDSFANLKESTIEKKLREEFLAWININNSRIIGGYKNLSLLHFLKIFAEYTNA